MTQTVSQAVGQIKNFLEGNFRQLDIEGEVTNLTLSSTGHWYFSLSDENSQLQAALFKMDAHRNPSIKNIKDGDKVVCLGGLGVYGKRGTFQIIVKKIRQKGRGDFKEKFDKLKKKLSREGLFDLEVKQKIPPFPRKVAIITALRGAALQDFLNVYKARSIWTKIMLAPSVVQGDTAGIQLQKSLIKIIQYAMKKPDDAPEVIVFARGGGALEDLWAFNDEALAWEIYNCPIPVISAIGHEVDFTICDFVSDLRCETPTAAAMVLTQAQVEVKDKLENIRKHLNKIGQLIISPSRRRLLGSHPQKIYNYIWDSHVKIKRRLESLNLISNASDLTKLYDLSLRLEESVRSLENFSKNALASKKNRLEISFSTMRALDPQNVLSRGYSYIEQGANVLIKNVKTFNLIKKGDLLKIHFKDGSGYVIKK